MTHRPALLVPALLLTGCFRGIEDWSDHYGVDLLPVSEFVRPDSRSPLESIATADPLVPIERAKARLSTRRAGDMLLAPFHQYLPAQPDSEEAGPEGDSTTAWAFSTDGQGRPLLARLGAYREVVSLASYPGGAAGLYCYGAPRLVAWTDEGAAALEVPGLGPAELEQAGVCASTSMLGAASGDQTLLVGTGASVLRLDFAQGLAEDLGPPPLAVEGALWLEEPTPGELEMVSGDGASLSWARSTGQQQGGSVQGELLADGVWRGADGALRLATDQAVYRWAPEEGGQPEQVAVLEAAPVQAEWEPVGAILLARATEPNPDAESLSVPVATAVAIPQDQGFAVRTVALTPCVDDETCRLYGESKVIGLAGRVGGTTITVYDLWTWAEEETHETWGSPD